MSTVDSSFPLITIGVTCFDASLTIRRAIASALAQEWPYVEIIIVDDCSTDDSAQIVRDVLAGIANARLIQHLQNKGVASARNTLINAAQGEFIAFFDDDDESAPNRISVQYQSIRRYEEYVGVTAIACYASGTREYPNGYRHQANAIGSEGLPPIGLDVVDYLLVNDRRPDIFYGSGTPACALMARTVTLRAVGGFDASLRRAEDIDLAIRLGFLGAHFIGCKEKLYLQYATVASDKTPAKNLDGELAIIDKYHDYLEKRGLYAYAKAWFVFRYKYFTRQYVEALRDVLVLFMQYPHRTLKHLWRSAPARLNHEGAMNAKPKRPQ